MTSPTIPLVDVTPRPGGVDLIVLRIEHPDGRVQEVGIGACAAYGLRDDLMRALGPP